jgi:octaprenyl-diphosphate synthase
MDSVKQLVYRTAHYRETSRSGQRRNFAGLTARAATPNIAALCETDLYQRQVEQPDLYALIADDMKAVDAVIRQRLHSDVALVRQIAEYIVSGGGKRMRPALVLMAARALGYQGDKHHELAAVVEFIHTATLLHDDVVDESTLRRGRETANTLFGNAASVLVGDFLYSRAFQMMVGVGSMRVQEVLADATNVIAEGEVLQLMNCHNADIDVEEYLQIIRFKTAKLFQAAARLGAILSNATPTAEDGLARYGMHIGTAFQLVDDILDYSGDEAEIGKHLGDDLAEGKPTLPLIHVLKHGTPEQAACVRKAIEADGRDMFTQVLAAVRASGALAAAHTCAQTEAQAAVAALAELPASIYKNALIELPTFSVARRS